MLNNKNSWTKWLSLAITVVVLVIVACLLFKTKETYVSGGGGNISKIDSISCTTESPESAFFHPKQEGETKHTIKVTFKSEKPDKISYDFDGIYNSAEIAEAREAEMHAKYNIYMGEKGLSASMLSPIFSTADNRLKVALYTDVKSLINTTISFFFLDMDDFQKVRSYSAHEFAELYENKGFSCTILE